MSSERRFRLKARFRSAPLQDIGFEIFYLGHRYDFPRLNYKFELPAFQRLEQDCAYAVYKDFENGKKAVQEHGAIRDTLFIPDSVVYPVAFVVGAAIKDPAMVHSPYVGRIGVYKQIAGTKYFPDMKLHQGRKVEVQ